MDKKKKKRIIIISCIIVLLIGLFFFLSRPKRLIKIERDDLPVTVSVYSEYSNFGYNFSFGMMGDYRYEIVVREKGLFGEELLREQFIYGNDGAPIHAGAVKPELEGDMVIITISGCEMDDLIFRVFID